MSVRFFLDTNVFICLLDATAPGKASRAAELVHTGLNEGAAAISYQVAQEFLNVVTRKIRPALRASDVRHYLDEVFEPLLQVESSLDLFRQALTLQSDHRLAWYDALIVAAALVAGCTILYTEDLQHGQRFGPLTVQNPFLTV